jgi:7-cyano-7-deazaguanine synthase
MEKCIVLLSSGLDSTVNFLIAKVRYDIVAAITFDYGQKAAAQEISRSQEFCKKHNVHHIIVPLHFFKEFTTTALVSNTKTIPGRSEIDLKSESKNIASAEKVWVPNRNGILLNIAAGYAEGLGAKYIVPGFNLEEASTFPDNSEEYQLALKNSFRLSTRNYVEVLCFTQNMMKTEILKTGLEKKLNIKDIWPCYYGDDQWCMNCESCLRFQRAAEENGIFLGDYL